NWRLINKYHFTTNAILPLHRVSSRKIRKEKWNRHSRIRHAAILYRNSHIMDNYVCHLVLTRNTSQTRRTNEYLVKFKTPFKLGFEGSFLQHVLLILCSLNDKVVRGPRLATFISSIITS